MPFTNMVRPDAPADTAAEPTQPALEIFEGATPKRGSGGRGPRHISELGNAAITWLAENVEPGEKVAMGKITEGKDLEGKARFVILGPDGDKASMEAIRNATLSAPKFVDSKGRKVRIMTRSIKHPTTGAQVIAAWRSHAS